MKNPTFSRRNPTFPEKSVFYPPNLNFWWLFLVIDSDFTNFTLFGQKLQVTTTNSLLLGRNHWKKWCFSVKCEKPQKTQGLLKKKPRRKAKVFVGKKPISQGQIKKTRSWEKTQEVATLLEFGGCCSCSCSAVDLLMVLGTPAPFLDVFKCHLSE